LYEYIEFVITRQERQEAWLDACHIDWKLRVALPSISLPVLRAVQKEWVR